MYKHTAAIVAASAIVATVAPTEARADPAAAAALAGQVTLVVDGTLTGHPAGVPLTPAQIRQAEIAIRGLVTTAAASGLSYGEILAAVSEGLGKSVAGRLGLKLGNWLTMFVDDTLGALIRMPLPMPLLMIISEPLPGMYGELPMAHVWNPYDYDYYMHDWGDTDDDDGTGWTGGHASNDDSYEPGGDRPRTKYDSSQHEDGYWTASGCFPPIPDVHHWQTVPCTGRETPAPMMLVDVMSPGDAVVGSAWVSTIPLGSQSEALLLLPEVQTMTPTVVHWF